MTSASLSHKNIRAKNEHEILRDLSDFKFFAPYIGKKYVDKRYKAYPFSDIFCDAIEKWIWKPDSRLIANMPPRVGKTENAVVLGTLYAICFLGPASFGYVTYSSDLSLEKSERIKDAYKAMLDSPLKKILNLPEFSKTQNAKGYWKLENGFEFKALGIGSSITGREFTHLWIDDPYKDFMAALSEAGRDKVQNYWSSSLYNRLAPDASVGLVHTRWHERDLTWYVQQEEKYEKIIFPAEAVGNYDILGRKEGEFLECRFGAGHWLKQKKTARTFFWQAMFQQAPEAKSGDWFTSPRIAPWQATAPPIAYIDTAFDGVDTVAESIIGTRPISTEQGLVVNEFDVLGRVWESNVFDVIDQIIDSLIKAAVKTVYVEKNADNGAFARKLRERLRELRLPINVIDDTATGDKHARIVSYAYFHRDSIVFSDESDEQYMRQVINYNKGVKPCDAPDSLAGGMQQLVRPAGQVEPASFF